ncbi:MAG TPA: APC family permease [Candidatus Dormibacteraeota bacterium]|jgi:APA family basic amino acid/polyamine antiporter
MSHDSVARRGRRPGDLRVVVRRAAKLPRTLGAPSLFAACYGNVGSSIYYALGVTAAFALGLTPLALLLAGAIFVTTALNYAEGTAALPHAGGSSSFARRAFNGPIGFLVGWVQLLNYTATVSISAYFAISYLGVFGKYLPLLDQLKNNDQSHVVATIVLISALIVLNVFGIQESSILNLILAFTDLVTQFVLVILGLVLLLNISTVLHNIHLGVAPTWGNFLASVSIAMVSYTGIETISNLSEEAKNPGRSVPRATFWVIAAVLFVSAFLPTIGLSVFPVHMVNGMFSTDLGTIWKADPVSGIVTLGFAQRGFQTLAFWSGLWVGFLAFTILVIATNAGLIGISRLGYSLAGADSLPRVFAALHPKYKTPYMSIIIFGIAAGLLVLPGILIGSKEIDLMSAVYSLAATFAFCSAHLSVMRLRFVEPDLYRPYRMPGNVKFGRDSIPILSVVGAIAIGTVFTQLMFQNISNSTFIYLGWLVLGVISFVLYRKHRKQPLWEPLEEPPPPDREVEHLPPEPLPTAARFKHGRRVPAHAAVARQLRHRSHRRGWRLEMELFFARHGNVRGALIVMVFAAVSGLAVGIDLSSYDPFGPGLGWSPGIVVTTLLAAYLLNRSHREV